MASHHQLSSFRDICIRRTVHSVIKSLFKWFVAQLYSRPSHHHHHHHHHLASGAVCLCCSSSRSTTRFLELAAWKSCCHRTHSRSTWSLHNAQEDPNLGHSCGVSGLLSLFSLLSPWLPVATYLRRVTRAVYFAFCLSLFTSNSWQRLSLSFNSSRSCSISISRRFQPSPVHNLYINRQHCSIPACQLCCWRVSTYVNLHSHPIHSQHSNNGIHSWGTFYWPVE